MIKKDVLIIGGGASGLYLGHMLQKHNIEFAILEKNPDCGGVIEEESFQGSAIPLGPRVFLTKRAQSLLELACEFNEPVIFHTKSLARYLLSHHGLILLSPKIFLKKPLGILKYLISKPLSVEQTIAEYFQALFGEEFTQEIIDPMTHGIWAASPQLLSMDTLMTDFKHKKLFSKKGPQGLVSFPSGLKALFSKVQNRLQDHIWLNQKALFFSPQSDHIHVTTNHNEFLVKKLVIATSFHHMKELVPDPLLDSLKTSSIDVVTFCFNQRQQRVSGSGYLIPTIRGFKTKGVLFDADLLQYQHIDMLSSFIQNSKNPVEEAYLELKKVLPSVGDYEKVICRNYPHHIFQCNKGSQEILKILEKKLMTKHIHLLGAYPRVGVYDCLDKAAKLCDTLTGSLASFVGNKS